MTTDRTVERSDLTALDLIDMEPGVGALVAAPPDAPLPLPTPGVTPGDRRRPGRLEHVSPALIHLLRLRPDADLFPIEDSEAAHPLRSARGICFAVIVGIVCWTSMLGMVIIMARW